jgi:hypothetical protein
MPLMTHIMDGLPRTPARYAINVDVAGDATFKAFIIPPKLSFAIDFLESGGTICPPTVEPLYFGSYSWVEAIEDELNVNRWLMLEGGRFGEAGTCDALRDINLTNCNLHVWTIQPHLVEVFEGDIAFGDSTDCPSSDNVSSDITVNNQTENVVSTNVRYWFNSHLIRQDCNPPYFLTRAKDNDYPF